MLKPLGNRVLIRPDAPTDRTESGLWLAEHRKPDQCGEVIAVGTPVHPRKQEAEAVAVDLDEVIDGRPRSGSIDLAVALLRDLVRREPCVKVGEWVVFSWNAGQELTVDGARYLLLPEDDILAVLEGV